MYYVTYAGEDSYRFVRYGFTMFKLCDVTLSEIDGWREQIDLQNNRKLHNIVILDWKKVY